MARKHQDYFIDVVDDGLPTNDIGPWAEQKYRYVGMDAELFATGMKNRWQHRVYLDLFSGSGYSRIRDINRLVIAAATAEAEGRTPDELLVAVANAADAARSIVDRTDFRVRSRLLAGELAAARPDLVGLQEVALWRSGPLDLARLGVPGATQVDYDFLQLLVDQLAARGADYEVAQVGVRADVEAPGFRGSPFEDTMVGARNIRLTMRDVILVRVDSRLRVVGTGDAVYVHNLAMTVNGTTL